jgi:signal transduction histidine kinase
VVGAWSHDGRLSFPVGATLDLDGDTVVAKVLRTGTPQRVERYKDAGGTLARKLSTFGYGGAVAAPVNVGGRLWGVLVAASAVDQELREGLEQQLGDFTELVAQALANADAYEQLAASRARLVEVGDAERRRLERNLHDGAQQRLVSVALELSMVSAKLESDPQSARTLLSSARDHLGDGLDELRELARGIHPAVLTDRGLGPALRSLADRAPLPVELAGEPPGDLPPPIATAIYFVVAEALTNVAKYARAQEAVVRVERAPERVLVEVTDDGVGGARLDGGSGLRGLSDRVAALDGRLELESPPGAGTCLRVELPGAERT